ncbi:conserved hypothetical protein [Deferribacter desulfuricans SSM1]|uniref:Uncharacterized protein n=1 Tax=Deferribacter desulfuricans (strain DSM 14783 / JCM 11476 / NBRC 101012 / SSM1) TaxID=639282 RepID=D3P9D0_DEFDS|nr:hypothetical protein [Deferribacter desulfuricans]BAI81320.1 conserved hypothetical protein [Deferribacter desulfuricans SSM1]
MKDKKKLLKDFEELAAKLGIKIRYEKTNARGGLCRVNENYYIIIDKKASTEYKLNIIAQSLKKFDLSEIHIKPKMRELLEEQE